MGIYGTGYTGTESPVSRSTTAKERDYVYSDLALFLNQVLFIDCKV